MNILNLLLAFYKKFKNASCFIWAQPDPIYHRIQLYYKSDGEDLTVWKTAFPPRELGWAALRSTSLQFPSRVSPRPPVAGVSAARRYLAPRKNCRWEVGFSFGC